MKRIGINLLYLIPNKVGGTEYLARSFIHTIQTLDKKNEYYIFCNKSAATTFNLTTKNITVITCPISGENRFTRVLYEQIVLPVQSYLYTLDILHSFGYVSPVITPCKKIVTVHDVNWKDQPDDFQSLTYFVFSLLCEVSVKRADIVITDSHFSKSRLLYHYADIMQKLVIISPGIENQFLSLIKEKTPSLVDFPYYLYVGGFYPHKNLPYLLRLWKELKTKNSRQRLVIVGHNGKDEKWVLQEIKKDSRIIYFSKVSLKNLAQLYKYADSFLFPSVYEGFGFPVYEAIACGTPTFVLRKDLFEPSVQSKINQLTGNVQEDAAHIFKQKGKIQPYTFKTYSEATKELIKTYEQL